MVGQYRDKKDKGEKRLRERVRCIRRSRSKVLDSFFGRGPEIWRLMGVMTPSLDIISEF